MLTETSESSVTIPTAWRTGWVIGTLLALPA